MIDTLVTGGTIATSSYAMKADIAIKDGVINAIGSPGFMQNAYKIVSAEGQIVIPGAIDPHVHLQLKSHGTTTKDDFRAGSTAAAFGGVTSMIDFAVQWAGLTPMEAITDTRKNADGNVSIDYSLHSCLTNADETTIAEIGTVVKSGITSFKMFMTYRNQGICIEDGMLIDLMREMSKFGGLAGVHAENDQIIQRLIDQFLKSGKVGAKYHAKSRPNVSEAEAIGRAIYFGSFYEIPVYIFHVSTKEGVDIIHEARSNGSKVNTEVCTHHLVLSDELYERDDAAKFVMTPPLRSKSDTEAMWEGLANGTISNVSSDHCSWDFKQKTEGISNFVEMPNGIAGVEVRVPVLFSEGVKKGRISLQQFVACVSTNPAKIFGMYPKKGSISVGSDADLTIIDPNLEMKISVDALHSNVDYTAFEGMKVTGYPVTTIARGELVVDDRQYVGHPGYGKFLQRGPPNLISSGNVS